MAKGPEWAKANLGPEKLQQVQRLIEVEEQLLFRCQGKPLVQLLTAREASGARPPTATTRTARQRYDGKDGGRPRPASRRRSSAGQGRSEAEAATPARRRRRSPKPRRRRRPRRPRAAAQAAAQPKGAQAARRRRGVTHDARSAGAQGQGRRRLQGPAGRTRRSIRSPADVPPHREVARRAAAQAVLELARTAELVASAPQLV